SRKMIIVDDMPLAIILMLLSLFCLGSWPVYLNILERRGRLPQHTYLDYAVTNFIVASLFALLLGQLGEETSSMPNFITQLQQENWPAVAIAMAGGFALCLGNILMQYSLAFCGISLTEVVSASLAVVGGTTINYFLDDGLNQAGILFPGVGCFLVAVILGSLCHASNVADIDAKFDPCKWKLSLESQDEICSDGDSSMKNLLAHTCCVRDTILKTKDNPFVFHKPLLYLIRMRSGKVLSLWRGVNSMDTSAQAAEPAPIVLTISLLVVSSLEVVLESSQENQNSIVVAQFLDVGVSQGEGKLDSSRNDVESENKDLVAGERKISEEDGIEDLDFMDGIEDLNVFGEDNAKGDDPFEGSVSEQQGQKHNRAGSNESLELIEHRRAIKVKGSSVVLGLVLAFSTGTCYALFSPLFNLATNDQLHLLKPEVSHLSVYTTFFYFSTAFFILGILVNMWLLYFPILGVPASSLSNYVSDSKGRHLAIMAGVVCGLGNGFQFMGGQAAGYAAADAVQALPLVGTFWGIVLFGEYRNSSAKTYVLLAGMLTMFAAAVALLVASSRARED
ncbi:hypothetical protein KI387_008806, partial [Taxus chinensis]